MKTQEEVICQHAVGPISIYKIYQEGYQDRELDDWETFRREAAKEILCAMIANSNLGYYGSGITAMVDTAMATARVLIGQLKENEI